MIVKSTRRGIDHRDLAEVAAHVLEGEANERVEVMACSGGEPEPDEVRALLQDAAALAHAAGYRGCIWHLMIAPAPGCELADDQWERAWEVLFDAYEADKAVRKLFTGKRYAHLFARVRHVKDHRAGAGLDDHRPDHEHGFMPTVRGDLTKVDPYRHRVINCRVARQLEFEFGHPMTGAPLHINRSVAAWFRDNGKPEIADAMEEAGLLDGGSGVQVISDRERQAALAEGRDPFTMVDALRLARQQASGPGRFVDLCAEQGIVIALGARRILAIGGDGLPVAVSRKLQVDEIDLREWLAPVLDQLPERTREEDHEQRHRDPGRDRRTGRRLGGGHGEEARPVASATADPASAGGAGVRDPGHGDSDPSVAGGREAFRPGTEPDRDLAGDRGGDRLSPAADGSAPDPHRDHAEQARRDRFRRLVDAARLKVALIRNESLLLQLRDAQRVGSVVPRLERMAERCRKVGDFAQASQLEEVIIRVREGHDITFKARVYQAWARMPGKGGASVSVPEDAVTSVGRTNECVDALRGPKYRRDP